MRNNITPQEVHQAYLEAYRVQSQKYPGYQGEFVALPLQWEELSEEQQGIFSVMAWKMNHVAGYIELRTWDENGEVD